MYSQLGKPSVFIYAMVESVFIDLLNHLYFVPFRFAEQNVIMSSVQELLSYIPIYEKQLNRIKQNDKRININCMGYIANEHILNCYLYCIGPFFCISC